MARRAVAKAAATPPAFVPVAWRDGVHLTGTAIWCDARRRRDVCFLSSADRAGKSGHGQLIATSQTLALVGESVTAGHLAVPLRRRFTLGTIRLELIPSGRGIGAAALHVDLAGRTVLYAGPVRTVSGGAGDPAEVRATDAVVVAAPFGDVKFPAIDAIADRVAAWAKATPKASLIVDTILDGIEVAQKLAPRVGIVIAKPIRDAIARAGLPAIGESKDGVTITTGKRTGARALVSPRAASGHAGFDAGFAWSYAADRKQLLEWIEATGAREVYVTGACADSIVRALGSRAKIIGPPAQMDLFG